MKIKLQWSKTQDYLIFDCINEDIAEWFINSCNNLNTQFNIANMITDIPTRSMDSEVLISEINSAIDLVNEFMPKIKQSPLKKPNNWYDQKQLNQLHKDWARTRIASPTLPPALFKINPKLFDAYNISNCHIHLIESSFKYCFRDNENHWRLSNPFCNKFYDWQVCHLYLPYPGHGRHAFEKFINFDNDVFVDDLCNWDNIDSCVGIDLVKPYKLEPPNEFLSWCQQYDIIPHTDTIPVANLEDWPNNLTIARELFTKNNKITDNYFKLKII